MSRRSAEILVVGAGIFGAAAALELGMRGYKVTLMDEGPLPHPLAASTDISKVVRMEYGDDAQYMAIVEKAIEGFRQWNAEFPEPLYHETGVTMFTRDAMAPGGFEYESFQTLLARGHEPERLGADEIARRYPAWKKGAYVDGFYHSTGGYAQSGKVVTQLIKRAKAFDVSLVDDLAREIVAVNGRVEGVRTQKGNYYSCGEVIVAAGSWTPLLVQELASEMISTGHPVFHLKPRDAALFESPHFATFTADVARSGWYGFPFHPEEGVIKIANHGVGREIHPENDERVVTENDMDALNDFLSFTFPALLEAPISYTRRCLYSDSRDGHLWIDRHPSTEGLTVAAGGSGHGFKFAPVLGSLIADAFENKDHPWLDKFRWRTIPVDAVGEEATRYHGQ